MTKQAELGIKKPRKGPTTRINLNLPSSMVAKIRESMETYGFHDQRSAVLHYLVKGMEAELIARKLMKEMTIKGLKSLQDK